VKWKGYNSDENSWEPKENLHGCTNAIRKFNKYEKEMRKGLSPQRVYNYAMHKSNIRVNGING
jgi:hypothetical protein